MLILERMDILVRNGEFFDYAGRLVRHIHERLLLRIIVTKERVGLRLCQQFSQIIFAINQPEQPQHGLILAQRRNIIVGLSRHFAMQFGLRDGPKWHGTDRRQAAHQFYLLAQLAHV